MLTNMTIRMLLQPLVENAVYHGLDQMEEGGLIRVSIRREVDMMLLEVADDGAGMRADEMEQLNRCFTEGGDYIEPGTGRRCIALTNINKRLNLHYDGNYRLTVKNAPVQGIIVCISIPLA
jgi:two-component system sensor histidine kinase YesM